MAEIREPLTLIDRFSGPLDRFVQKLSKSVDSTQENTKGINKMSDATAKLVADLGSAERAFQGAFTDKEADAALQNLQKQMKQAGLVWTNTADQMEASDLLARVGLEKLAQSGRLAASAAVEESTAAEKATQAQERHQSKLQSVARAAKNAVASFLGFNKVKSPLDSINSKLTRMALYFFSVRKLIGYIRDAMERAPDSIAKPFENLKNTISDTFGRTVVSLLAGMQTGVEKLNAALSSSSGQKFMRGLETVAQYAGQAIGFLLDKISSLIEWVGDNFQSVMAAASIAVGLFAVQMLGAAAATIAATWPILLIVGLAASLVVGLMKAGVTAEEIFSGIGSAAGWLYATIYNLVADAYNLFATFAEFFANVFNDPLAAVGHLFFDVFDSILGIVETVAKAIDALLGTDMSSAINGFRDKLQNFADMLVGENKIKVDRMEKLDVSDTMSKFSDKASSIGTSLSNFSLSNALATPIKNIEEDVGKIQKTVTMTDENLKFLVDMAERRYVNNINLTAQTPVINITGQNTGNTTADRQALANTIKDILIEQVASGSTRTTARAF